jgi:L-ribulose-5-phosphate 4-epimerase
LDFDALSWRREYSSRTVLATITCGSPMRDEGVTKYECFWNKSDPPSIGAVSALITCRDRLFTRGLIGVYSDGIGYGNVSERVDGYCAFYITGTQTGEKAQLTVSDISIIKAYSIADNRVECCGEIAASSETLTHAAVYELDRSIRAVIHVHHRALWEKAQGLIPTTARSVPYGTPAMALEMRRLYEKTNLKDFRVLVMAGHDEGLISFGKNLSQAEAQLARVMQQFIL